MQRVPLRDRLLAVCLLVISTPVIVLSALALFLETGVFPIFTQSRFGRRGTIFQILKFRTLRLDAPLVATHQLDPVYLTKVGSFLRRSHIDELPQLWNVAVGDMRLVGPRPSLLNQSQVIAARRSFGVDDMFPGMTGIAQILGVDMSSPRRLARLDALYRRKRSFLFDMKIIALTLISSLVLRNQRARLRAQSPARSELVQAEGLETPKAYTAENTRNRVTFAA